MGLNVTNGDCVNITVPQNVTFGEQGGVLDNGSTSVTTSGHISYMTLIVCAVVAFFGLL